MDVYQGKVLITIYRGEIVKIKIDKVGYLYIERHGRMTTQTCPFMTKVDDWAACNDYCPHFGEPKDDGHKNDAGYIDICHEKRIHFTECIDERGQDATQNT